MHLCKGLMIVAKEHAENGNYAEAIQCLEDAKPFATDTTIKRIDKEIDQIKGEALKTGEETPPSTE